ncbi:MAG TPA: hypothetical protein VD861_03675 [Pyrinomonadaceae bacterium]|nr:hypothetical protein [Pyrinomonadaceae bacterium]
MAEAPTQPDAPLQLDLGSVETLLGNLQFTFIVSPEGDAHIQVYATDPSAAGKGGVMLMLDARGYERLKAIVGGTDRVIDRMIAEGKIKRMVLPY